MNVDIFSNIFVVIKITHFLIFPSIESVNKILV